MALNTLLLFMILSSRRVRRKRTHEWQIQANFAPPCIPQACFTLLPHGMYADGSLNSYWPLEHKVRLRGKRRRYWCQCYTLSPLLHLILSAAIEDFATSILDTTVSHIVNKNAEVWYILEFTWSMIWYRRFDDYILFAISLTLDTN